MLARVSINLSTLAVKISISSHASVPGRINQVLQSRASNPYLAQQGFSTGFAECIYINRSQRNQISPGPVADAVEAVIAAVFFDSSEDMQVVEKIMTALGICWP